MKTPTCANYLVRQGALLCVIALACLVAQRAGAIINATLQMQLGNPSGATADASNHNHYLIQRAVEAMDYSDTWGEPVWASWDLTSADLGSATRSSSYFTDTNLPAGFYRVTDSDYVGVGSINFNRGHLCPSADRTDSRADNDAVFFMSNIMPQSALNNQTTWGNLEDYCRASLSTNELLIICGPSGFSGAKLPSGKAWIPSNTWKVVVCAPLGAGTAVSRLTPASRVIAISIPNVTNGLNSSWQNYVTSPGQIEKATGLTFFSALPAATAASFRARVDGTAAPALTSLSPAAGAAGGSVTINGNNFTGASAVWFNGTNAAFTVVSASQISATVPAGATTGPVSVITPGGLAASAGNFTVQAAVAPRFVSISDWSNRISLVITGAPSVSYTLSACTNLGSTNWLTLLATNPATLPWTYVDTNRLARRFYRVQNP